MNYSLFVILLTIATIGNISAQTTTTAPTLNFLYIGTYDECEGKDSANYTLIIEQTEDYSCDQSSSIDTGAQLVQCQSSGTRAVNGLQTLAASKYPAGAYRQEETLWLSTSGPLQGKYLYQKVIFLSQSYLKKCSSILGYSYVTSKTASLLINEKLDLNVLISPTGAYDAFKKGCTTLCRGRVYVV